MTLLEEAKKTLAAYGASPRKNLGQNFMIREEALSTIAQALKLSPGQAVVEIGPGLGFLTKQLLLKKACVTAIEKDKIYALYLKDKFRQDSFDLVEADVLNVDFKRDLKIQTPTAVAGNIPYNITSPILEWLIENREFVSQAVLTIQWEVAQRMLSKPGSKLWGSLSVFVHYHAEVVLVKKIDKGAFYPAPKVDSCAILIDFTKPFAKQAKDSQKMFRIVRGCFQKRRKTILNSLSSCELFKNHSPAEAKSLAAGFLNRSGISEMARPEVLQLQEWIRLSDEVSL